MTLEGKTPSLLTSSTGKWVSRILAEILPKKNGGHCGTFMFCAMSICIFWSHFWPNSALLDRLIVCGGGDRPQYLPKNGCYFVVWNGIGCFHIGKQAFGSNRVVEKTFGKTMCWQLGGSIVHFTRGSWVYLTSTIQKQNASSSRFHHSPSLSSKNKTKKLKSSFQERKFSKLMLNVVNLFYFFRSMC